MKNGSHLGFLKKIDISFCPCNFCHPCGPYKENLIKTESVVLECRGTNKQAHKHTLPFY